MAKIKPGIKISTVSRVLQNEPSLKAGRQHFSTQWCMSGLLETEREAGTEGPENTTPRQFISAEIPSNPAL